MDPEWTVTIWQHGDVSPDFDREAAAAEWWKRIRALMIEHGAVVVAGTYPLDRVVGLRKMPEAEEPQLDEYGWCRCPRLGGRQHSYTPLPCSRGA